MSGTQGSIVVVMGVSGSGKSTVGIALAARLGWDFQEGDDLHPAANVAKMRAGIPLDDTDRAPWLAAIAAWMDQRISAGQSAIVSCSALHRASRDLLRAGRPEVRFVYLRVSRAELERRVTARHHQYMPASLLGSQLATLEEPEASEPRVVTIDADGTIDAVVDAMMRAIANRES